MIKKLRYLLRLRALVLTAVMCVLGAGIAWGDVYEQLTSIESIDESAQYVLGVDGSGFHYEGTSSWGKTALPTVQTPIYYTLTKAPDGKSFTAQATINETTYYLQVPTSNTFSMATSTGTNTDLIIGTTQVSGTNYAVANKTTTTRHLRRNGSNGLRSYAGTTGDMAFFYKVVKSTTITFFRSSKYILIGGTYTQAAITENAGGATITYSSSDTDIATVNQLTGEVTGRAAGTTTINASITVNGITYAATYSIVVYDGNNYAIDEIDNALTGVGDAGQYSDWSGKSTGTSNAVYAGNSAGSSYTIQLRSTDNSGIVSTTSGGFIRKVVIEWHSTTERTIDIFGNNTPYSSTSNLYSSNENDKGTKIGSIAYGSSTELSISDDYNYIGICSSSGALYLDRIIIIWEKQGGVPSPSISADNVEIAYSAEDGVINYSITNAVEGGELTASTTATWLSLGDVETNSVPFTCSANETTEPRTATITLSYTYGDNETVTKNVTVTQAAAPVIYTTIPALFEAATSTEIDVTIAFGNWVVSGVSTNGKNIFVTDNNGNGFVVYYGSDMSSTFSAGNILSGTVSCKLKKFNGFAELVNLDANDLTITTGGSVTTFNIAMADLTGVNTGALVSYEGLTCSVTTSGNNTNYFLSDGTTDIQVYNSLYAFDVLEAGKQYNITGVYQQYNTKKEILPRSAEDIVEVEEPSITVASVEVEVDAAGAEGTINVTYNNIANVEAEVQFVGADGTSAATYDWIVAEVNDENNISYIVNENTNTEARTAYLIVYALDDNANVVYSDLITIVQAAAVSPGTGDQYALFNGDLVEGDYIIYYNGKAMNTTITNNRLQYAEVTPANNVISTDNTAIVWHIAKSGDYWTIYNADADAYAAATSSNNQAQMLADGTDDKALWTVSDEYDFTNKANSRLLRNNGTYGFACYGANTGGALSLYKKVEAVAEDVTIDEADYVDEAYVPTEKYANVTFKRTLVEGWNGLVLPFDMTVEDAKTKFKATAVKDFTGVTYDSEKGTTLNFSDATEIKAGKPFMIKATAAGTEYTFEGVQLKSSTLQTISQQEGDAKYTMTGTYQKVDLTNENFVLIQGNKYYQHNTNKASSAKAFRAYFVNESTGEALSKGININFGGEATGIELVENGQFANDLNGVYNLQGQKVNNAQKGVYIVNGKKIVVK